MYVYMYTQIIFILLAMFLVTSHITTYSMVNLKIDCYNYRTFIVQLIKTRHKWIQKGCHGRLGHIVP